MNSIKPDTSELLPWEEYDLFIVSYSGGKDGLGCLLGLLDLGIPRHKIELWHQDVDGHGEALMDWPCTPAYVQATADALGIPVVWSWREGGFVGEMLRDNASTGDVLYEREGVRHRLPTKRANLNTRLKFPQVSADLSVRWCSAYLKIDVGARVLANDPAYRNKKICYLTGERRQESTARSKYATVERHRTNNKRRRVDQWRAVLDWSEQDVWNKIEQWHVRPHPAYSLGFGRVSCMTCIFIDRNQWASVNYLAPDRLQSIAGYERQFGLTIKRGESVEEQAARGQEFVSDKPVALRELAMSPDQFKKEHFFLPKHEKWQLPPGAFKRCGGPT